ncbi:MAG: hypothetical protein JWM20_670 [Patescibacteria group bacterium]|nr:hypothetical protein [Patescibacteria group bacterium]
MNDKKFLQETYRFFNEKNISVWLFGGWAEELRGMVEPRNHNDIDFLYLAENFNTLDELIRNEKLEEILAKRLHHKRALLINGIMIEFILVTVIEHRFVTKFFGTYDYEWPSDIFSDSELSGIKIVSKNTLSFYRNNYSKIAELSRKYFDK